MARNTIIGVGEPFVVEDKDTGKKIKMVRVYVVRQAMDVFGQKAQEITLHGMSYKRIEKFEDDVSQLLGLECDVDYTVNSKGRGQLENFELILENVKS